MISSSNPDNRPDLQTAIDNLSASGGGTLTLTAGRYELSIDPATEMGLKLKSNVTLRGSGVVELGIKQGSTIASPNALVWAASATNIGLDNITLDADVDLTATAGRQTTCLELRTVDGLTLTDVTFRGAISDGFANGGYGVVAWYGATDNVTMTRCAFSDIGQTDLGLFWGNNWNVTDCTSTNTGYCPINVESTTGATISNVTIDGWTIDGCQFAALTSIQNESSTVTDVTIRNVTATTVHGSDLMASIGGCRVRGTTRTTLENITLATVYSHPLYVTVDSGYPVTDLTVRNLTATDIRTNVNGTRSHGVWLQGTAAVGIAGVRLEHILTHSPTADALFAEYTTGIELDPASTVALARGGITLLGSTATLMAD